MKILTKENSPILRGLAIITIMMHNFLHIGRWGFSAENEMSFTQAKVDAFWNAILSSQTNFLGEAFSFLGWVGVPVFIFLTGYGVAVQGVEGRGNKVISLKKRWFRLFLLMFPAVLLFGTVDFISSGMVINLLKRGLYLTQLANFFYPYVVCQPGVYWYFGLAFQLYLIWALIGSHLKGLKLLLLSIITLSGLYFLSRYGSHNVISIYRHCFTGWFEVFAFGILMAQNKWIREKFTWHWSMEIVFFLLLSSMMVLLNKRMETWLFVPFFSLLAFIFLGNLCVRVELLTSVLKWLGNISAYIFVCHPIARPLAIRFTPAEGGLALIVTIYVVLTIILSMTYKRVYEFIYPFAERHLFKNYVTES